MDQQKTVLEIEARAAEERVSIRCLCQRAGVHPTTFFRWKKSPRNPKPVGANLATINKLTAELDKIAGENRRRRAGKVAA